MTHPRVGARRAEVRRQQARRRFRLAVAMLAVFTLMGLAWLTVQSSLLDVDHVKVRGAKRAGSKAVARAAAVEKGSALLVLDRGEVARRVERLPWVLDARVSADLPGTLVIRVRERTPAAWAAGGKRRFVLLDAEARVLDVRRQAPAGLPEVVVSEPPPAPGETFAAVRAEMAAIAAAPAGLRSRLLSVDEDKGRLDVAVEGVDEVLFGRAERMEQKWEALQAVLTEVGDGPVHRVDVRVPSAPAVVRSRPAPPDDEAQEGDEAPASTTSSVPA